jgi:hypothetical protein
MKNEYLAGVCECGSESFAQVHLGSAPRGNKSRTSIKGNVHMHYICLDCGAECNSAIHQFVINARVSECSPSIIIAGVAGVVSHYVPTLSWLVRAAAANAAVCADERRELKHNH